MMQCQKIKLKFRTFHIMQMTNMNRVVVCPLCIQRTPSPSPTDSSHPHTDSLHPHTDSPPPAPLIHPQPPFDSPDPDRYREQDR